MTNSKGFTGGAKAAMLRVDLPALYADTQEALEAGRRSVEWLIMDCGQFDEAKAEAESRGWKASAHSMGKGQGGVIQVTLPNAQGEA